MGTSLILICCEMNDGLSKFQLKAVFICWLTVVFHCGGVITNPLHTLLVLTVTISPVYDVWASYYKSEVTLGSKNATSIQAGSAASPSSVPSTSESSDLPMFNLSASEK